jgi:hypothetical protein
MAQEVSYFDALGGDACATRAATSCGLRRCPQISLAIEKTSRRSKVLA